MALYKTSAYLTQSNHANFDLLHQPGTKTGDAGIYRCEGCGHEIGIADDKTMPPQNHHQHTQSEGSIRWRLIVAAQPKK